MKTLKETPDDGSGKQLVSAVTVAYCFYQLSISMHPKLDDFAVPLLQMLRLKPSNKICPGYDLLCSVMPRKSR